MIFLWKFLFFRFPENLKRDIYSWKQNNCENLWGHIEELCNYIYFLMLCRHYCYRQILYLFFILYWKITWRKFGIHEIFYLFTNIVVKTKKKVFGFSFVRLHIFKKQASIFHHKLEIFKIIKIFNIYINRILFLNTLIIYGLFL